MKRKFALMLAAVLTVLLCLCGCTEHDAKYDDNAALCGYASGYATITYFSNTDAAGGSVKAGSFSGVRHVGKPPRAVRD